MIKCDVKSLRTSSMSSILVQLADVVKLNRPNILARAEVYYKHAKYDRIKTHGVSVWLTREVNHWSESAYSFGIE